MTDIYIETCTIHDDTYLTPHEIYLSRLESGDNSGKSYQCGGGFSLDLKNDNRFIIWRIIGNKLELIEHSLASKLNSNFKRIYFRDANVIPRVLLNKSNEIGTSFNISILFATTSRLFRIILPFNINVKFDYHIIIFSVNWLKINFNYSRNISPRVFFQTYLQPTSPILIPPTHFS